jgi:hypothetical protein
MIEFIIAGLLGASAGTALTSLFHRKERKSILEEMYIHKTFAFGAADFLIENDLKASFDAHIDKRYREKEANNEHEVLH